jgi:hypothetical protein
MAERGKKRITVTVIRKGAVGNAVNASIERRGDGYVLEGLPLDLTTSDTVLALVVHFVENEAGYILEDKEG